MRPIKIDCKCGYSKFLDTSDYVSCPACHAVYDVRNAKPKLKKLLTIMSKIINRKYGLVIK